MWCHHQPHRSFEISKHDFDHFRIGKHQKCLWRCFVDHWSRPASQTQKEILEKGILSQQQDLLLYDDTYTIEFSTLEPDFAEEILKVLQAKPEKKEIQHYSQTQNKYVSLLVKPYTVDQQHYHSCAVQENSAPPVTNKLDITYQKKQKSLIVFQKVIVFAIYTWTRQTGSEKLRRLLFFLSCLRGEWHCQKILLTKFI